LDAADHPGNNFNQEDSSACQVDEDSSTDAMNDSKEDIKLEYHFEQSWAKGPSDQVSSSEGPTSISLNDGNSSAPMTVIPVKVKEEFPSSCCDSAFRPGSEVSIKESAPSPWQRNTGVGSSNDPEVILGVPSDVVASVSDKVSLLVLSAIHNLLPSGNFQMRKDIFVVLFL